MDLECTAAALLSKNKELEQENVQLRTMLGSNKEKTDPKAGIQSFRHDTAEELPDGAPSCSLWQSTLDERNFQKNLQPSKAKHEHRISSPVDFKSFLQNSMYTDASEKAEFQSCQADVSLNDKDEDRLLGEIAFQLDRRILKYVFQGHRRVYGFTLLNIADKIREVSTHPLTGKVDVGYQLHLSQRHAELMERLSQLGYKTALHPVFNEFIVNTYGLLTERPSAHSSWNNFDSLFKAIKTKAPSKLQKDLLLVLTCLCDMAQRDGKPLLCG
ncbi:speriolin-like protein isoform X2 [Xyrichtys novacula]|uniref:Speriolin-like protein isoform X2 n=1 Tax=Xyrichtys novacula TaxID=13765 RepID=A0AAV1FN97_XYRNO|nr:speriolin-like protein isoform X2 [Xyrichtys novacula]